MPSGLVGYRMDTERSPAAFGLTLQLPVLMCVTLDGEGVPAACAVHRYVVVLGHVGGSALK